ncbi:recombinase family protein [Kitasatospora viridis]|uniref:Resolvase-like protein n=1 Tax=Kitasatospora viridis TaxID=281105 RepID=A0A561S972_9ACTN|nr:recombinase family protein [Kitasatospora viridis]TWF71413.1 hypothetical protein FHX73_1943 [Kitasatospora viridis]
MSATTDHLPTTTPPRTAAYLRCFPFDHFQMTPHRNAVLDHAQALALPAPAIFIDNGRLASQALPELQRLLRAVASGFFGVVLLPGLFVLSLDEAVARSIVRALAGHGCQVIVLP